MNDLTASLAAAQPPTELTPEQAYLLRDLAPKLGGLEGGLLRLLLGCYYAQIRQIREVEQARDAALVRISTEWSALERQAILEQQLRAAEADREHYLERSDHWCAEAVVANKRAEAAEQARDAWRAESAGQYRRAARLAALEQAARAWHASQHAQSNLDLHRAVAALDAPPADGDVNAHC